MQSGVQSTATGSGSYNDPRPRAWTTDDDLHTVLVNRISWGAVFAGVVLMLSAHVLLNMVGAGLGAAAIDPQTGDNPSLATFSMTAGLWWSVAGIIASFIGALIAARLSGSPKPSTGALHGITAWGLTLLVMVWLFSTAASTVAGGAFSAISSTLSGMGRSVGAVAQSAVPAVTSAADPFAQIEQQIRAQGNDPAALRDGAVSAVRALVTGDQAQAAQARERAADALARAQNIPIEEARTRVAQMEAQYRQTIERARQTATETADAAARTVSQTTLFAALALFLGGLASWFGGRMGVVNPERVSRAARTTDTARPATTRG